MPGFDLVIDRKVYAGDWAVPNIMVTFPMADKAAAIFAQNVSDLLFILRHYADIPTLFSNRKFSLPADG